MKKSILAVVALLLVCVLCGCNLLTTSMNSNTSVVVSGETVSTICIEKKGTITIDDENGKNSYNTVYTHDEVIKRTDGLIEVRGTSTADGGATYKVRWLYTADGKQIARRTYENGSYSDYASCFETTIQDYAMYLDGVKNWDDHVVYYEDGAREVMNINEYGLTESVRIYNAGEETPWLMLETEFTMLNV